MPDHETITQANRLLQLKTQAADDVLLITRFTGSEAISRPFRYEVEMIADILAGMPSKVNPHQLVGTLFTINVKLDGSDNPKVITGYCESFTTGNQDKEFQHYTAVLVPWFWFLNMNSNLRFFQNKTVPDIVAEVIQQAGYSSSFQNNTTKTYTTWDYCTQYRETDFAFISRILEAEGIYYYFEPDEQAGHKMVIADAPSCYSSLPNISSFAFSPDAGIADLSDTIRSWASLERIHTGQWSLNDYHHEMPTSNLKGSSPSSVVASVGQSFSKYDYPGDFSKKFNNPAQRLSDVNPEGTKLTDVKMQIEETTRVEFSGTSLCRAFQTGFEITVTGGSAAGSYLLTEVAHECHQQPAYRPAEEVAVAYRNTFRCIQAAALFTPSQVIPKAVAYGLQPAIVVTDSSGEEIWPDKYGRIKVQFPWDVSKTNTCWLRVIQSWAGKQWGHQWIPRVGDEVLVSFIEGDPDQPIVVGSVYNSDNMPIFTLPDNKTQSGLQTHSSTGGGSSDYNMLRFEDKNGSEEIYIQAQKDWNAVVKNNKTTKVHVNDTRTVETGDDTLTVQKGKRTTTIQQNDSRTVQQGDDSITIQTGKRTITVAQNISETSQQGNISTTASMGNISTTASMGNISTTASLGSITIEASVASVTISGLEGVTISCGASSIQMTPASISISAPMVLINS